MAPVHAGFPVSPKERPLQGAERGHPRDAGNQSQSVKSPYQGGIGKGSRTRNVASSPAYERLHFQPASIA